MSQPEPIPFTIDGRPVEVPAGGTLLDGARKLGIDIPTLCYLERCGPMTSCLVCVVRLTFNGRTSVVPSCAMKAAPGMVVESETPAVHELRRSALELLLSDHVGDCLSPCARICPLGMNIPQMLRQVQEGQPTEAAATVRAALALPAVLGRLCHRPCENGCRRAACDSAAAIQDVERFVADTNRAAAVSYLPPRKASTGHRVAVIGSGPAALAAAYVLVREGHGCVVLLRGDAAGGTLRREVERGGLPGDVLGDELRDLARFGIEFRTAAGVTTLEQAAALLGEFGAVLVAWGESGTATAKAAGGAAAAGLGATPAKPYSTRLSGVFCAGTAVRPLRQVVKAMADGQAAAEAVHEFLNGREPKRAQKPFSSLMGRLEASELALFREGASPSARVEPSGGTGGDYTLEEAERESARCLHCDCRAAGDCRLQHYSQVYGAEFGRFSRQRRAFEQQRHPGRVLFEPGKCILCGICVHIASQAAEPLGLTFVGRGFDVRVAAPLNEAFERGLQKVAVECAEACPTGAIQVADPTDAFWSMPRLPAAPGRAGHPGNGHGGCGGCGH